MKPSLGIRLALGAALAAGALGACSSSTSSGSASTTAATAPASTTTITNAPTTAPATTTTPPVTAPPTTAPATTAPATSAPATTAPADDAWLATFNQAAAQSGRVVGDDTTAVATSLGNGDWSIVATGTGRVVTAHGLRQIIGVGTVADGFVVVTNRGDTDTTVDLAAVAADGTVRGLGAVATPVEFGQSPQRAHVVQRGATTYVLVQTPTNTVQSVATPATVVDGTVTTRTQTIYGTITFTDDDGVLVTGGPGGQLRTLSHDGGATWEALPVVPPGPTVLLSLSNDRVIGYQETARGSVNVYAADGTTAPVATDAGYDAEWLTVADPGNPDALLVEASSGRAMRVNRTTGAPASPLAPLFSLASVDQALTVVWTTTSGRHQGVVSGQDCENGCVSAPRLVLAADG